MLQGAIKEDPGNEILAWMLRDELVEVRGMLPTEAAQHVESYARAMKWHRDLTRVAKWLSATSQFAVGITDEIHRLAKVDLTDPAAVVLCLGPYAPSAHRSQQPTEEGYWPTVTITVGASWLLEHYADRAMLFDRGTVLKRVVRRRKKS